MNKFKIGQIVRNETSASENRGENGNSNTIAVVTDILTGTKGTIIYETEYLSDEEGIVGEPQTRNYVEEMEIEEAKESFDYVDDDDELKNRAEELTGIKPIED